MVHIIEGEGNNENNERNDISQTGDVGALGATAIKDNFLMLQKDFLEKNRECICRYSPEVKSLLGMPELKDITPTHIENLGGDTLFIRISTNFTGDIYQYLLDNGISKEVLRISPQNIVSLRPNNSCLQITIYQAKLAK